MQESIQMNRAKKYNSWAPFSNANRDEKKISCPAFQMSDEGRKIPFPVPSRCDEEEDSIPGRRFDAVETKKYPTRAPFPADEPCPCPGRRFVI
ncbi:hypothetical protein AVEN_63066-1 [Araneus ventricosus]|uniref:Uncharacterized protein n=1 Tax=Araneus ventricosus TaxID=182803 RepID=A0A4Y2H1K2_ARAVE|nr:hypothetical protein AVEN_63066-1 [Araneus ventricosus]